MSKEENLNILINKLLEFNLINNTQKEECYNNFNLLDNIEIKILTKININHIILKFKEFNKIKNSKIYLENIIKLFKLDIYTKYKNNMDEYYFSFLYYIDILDKLEVIKNKLKTNINNTKTNSINYQKFINHIDFEKLDNIKEINLVDNLCNKGKEKECMKLIISIMKKSILELKDENKYNIIINQILECEDLFNMIFNFENDKILIMLYNIGKLDLSLQNINDENIEYAFLPLMVTYINNVNYLAQL